MLFHTHIHVYTTLAVWLQIFPPSYSPCIQPAYHLALGVIGDRGHPVAGHVVEEGGPGLEHVWVVLAVQGQAFRPRIVIPTLVQVCLLYISNMLLCLFFFLFMLAP